MNVKKNYKKGKRIELLKAVYATGSLPYRSLRLYDWQVRITQRVVHEMVDERLLKIVKTETGKQINLVKWDDKKADYMDYLPIEYLEYYESELKEEVRQSVSVRTRGERLQKSAELILIMHESGIGSYPDEKVSIRKSEVRITHATKMYFTSREIRGVMPYHTKVERDKDGKRKVGGSRMHGLMVSPGGVYAVYNIGSHLIEWERYGETNMARHIDRVLDWRMDGYLERKEKDKTEVECMLFAADVAMFERVILNENKKRRTMTLLNIDYAYENMYGLPLNHDGKRMLAIMSSKGWQERMRIRMLPEETGMDSLSYTVACDAYVGGKYILLFCIPNINKLKMFLKRAAVENNKDKFHIYCFTYQVSLVVSLAGGYTTIHSYGLPQYYDIELKEGFIEKKGV